MLKKLGKGCLILSIGGVVLLLVLALLVDEGAEQTTEPTDVPTGKPSPTLAPVATPTEKPVPTDTAQPALEIADIQDYLTEMQNIDAEILVALSELARMGQEASDDPTVLLDSDWVDDFRGSAQDLIDTYEAAQNVEPPDILAEYHDLVTTALSKCASSGEFMIKAMDAFQEGDFDVTVQYLTEGTNYMVECTTDIEPATELLNTILADITD